MGTTLSHKLSSANVRREDVVSLGLQIASALEEAHEHGIVIAIEAGQSSGDVKRKSNSGFRPRCVAETERGGGRDAELFRRDRDFRHSPL